MNFFRTDGETKKQKELIERAQYVRRGGSLNLFKPADVIELQTYAMDIKDNRLYDYLEKFWHGDKPAAEHQHAFEVRDCARPMVCACGEVRP